jgi:PAS domain-containing protein
MRLLGEPRRWTVGAVLASMFACGFLLWLYSIQREDLGLAMEHTELVRTARIDLTKGALRLADSHTPQQYVFNRAEAIALTQQALDALGASLALQPEAVNTSISQTQLQRLGDDYLAQLRAQSPDLRDTIDLRVAYGALDRFSEDVDQALNLYLQQLTGRSQVKFMLALLGTGILLTLLCLGMLMAYHRETRLLERTRQAMDALYRNDALLLAHKLMLEETGRIAKVGGWTLDVASGKGAWTDELARIHDLDNPNEVDLSHGLGFYTEESRVLIAAAVDQAIRDGQPYDLTLELISAKGVHKWVRTIGHAEWLNGKVVRLHGSLQDVTELKHLQEQFLRAQRLE